MKTLQAIRWAMIQGLHGRSQSIYQSKNYGLRATDATAVNWLEALVSSPFVLHGSSYSNKLS
jgi:hypothetical protein